MIWRTDAKAATPAPQPSSDKKLSPVGADKEDAMLALMSNGVRVQGTAMQHRPARSA